MNDTNRFQAKEGTHQQLPVMCSTKLKCPKTKDKNATCMPSIRMEWCSATPATKKQPIGLKRKGLLPKIGQQ